VDKIVCVGKNYLEHAKELGDAVPDKPVLFLKPPSSLVQVDSALAEVEIPKGRGSVHPECEIVLKLKKGGSNLSSEEAATAIDEVTIGFDLTLRDLQAELKKAGHPWTVSKVFRNSAVVGPWLSASSFSNFLVTPFYFWVGGELRQKGTGKEMMLSPAQCVSYISEQFPLVEGDMIFTGTPVGVNLVVPGQVAKVEWGKLTYSIQWR
jgi:2-keto-4-pentenoate hydratase/2-oxohepta-3-ene-1,7-dioic acid hydratase in catechol pathway